MQLFLFDDLMIKTFPSVLCHC